MHSVATPGVHDFPFIIVFSMTFAVPAGQRVTNPENKKVLSPCPHTFSLMSAGVF
jgi:hypothetical protein